MKKKIFGMILASLLLFSVSGNSALASDCGCHEELTGSEKNKEVANLLKSDGFKEKKQELLAEGYHWNGVNTAEVAKIEYGTGVAVSFVMPTGQQEIFFFLNNGKFLFSFPL
jgi:hypothetical protein